MTKEVEEEEDGGDSMSELRDVLTDELAVVFAAEEDEPVEELRRNEPDDAEELYLDGVVAVVVLAVISGRVLSTLMLVELGVAFDCCCCCCCCISCILMCLRREDGCV